MTKQTISPQEFDDLPRKIKRELARQAKKEGRELPKIPKMAKIYTQVDKDLWDTSLRIMEKHHITIQHLFETTLRQLIEAEREANPSKLK